MSGMLDSEPVFQSRLRDLNIADRHFAALKANGVDPLGRFAYICTLQPGLAADDTPFVTALVKALSLPLNTELQQGELSAFRRLWVESYTVSIAEIRGRVERTEDSVPKKLPQPERVSRRAEQQRRLPGIKIVGLLEPANCLVDFCQAMREENVLQFVDPTKCVSRDQELHGTKREKFLKADPATGMVKEVNRETELWADLSSEYRVRNSLLRRSLAMDQVDLLPFHDQEAYHDYIFNLIASEPLSTHNPISMEQGLRADRLIWHKMAELTRDGITPTIRQGEGNPIKEYPMVQALKLAMIDPIVSAALQPLPKSSSSNQTRQSPYDWNGQNQKGAKSAKVSKGKGKGKGAKGQSKSSSSAPSELSGLRQTTSKGLRYCYNSNLPAGCTYAKFGGQCKSGFHGCMGCGQADHGYQSCPKKG